MALLRKDFPPSRDETGPVESFFTPWVRPVTLTLKMQLTLAASAAPVRETVPDPATALIMPPPQLPVSPLGVETTKPEGRVSVKLMPDSAVVAFGLLMVKVSVVEPLSGIVPAPNAMPMTGGATTVSDAVAEAPLPP